MIITTLQEKSLSVDCVSLESNASHLNGIKIMCEYQIALNGSPNQNAGLPILIIAV